MLTQPLSKRELDRLEAFLISETTPKRCLNLEGLDGFLTALVCGPETVLPSEFIDAIWGGEEMVWESQKQAQEVFMLIMRHWNSIVAELQADDFKPLLDADEKEFRARDWATGFIRGMALRREAWKSLMKDQEHGFSLSTLAVLSGGEIPPALEPAARDRVKLVRGLPEMVLKIHRYWLPFRQAEAPSTAPRSARKVGRNEFCPCGSGRKFKQCCGRPHGRN